MIITLSIVRKCKHARKIPTILIMRVEVFSDLKHVLMKLVCLLFVVQNTV